MSEDAGGLRVDGEPEPSARERDGDRETPPAINPDGNERTADDPADSATTDLLRARVALLEEENERLRYEYARAKRSAHRRTAIGFGLLGVTAAVGATLFPPVRTVLLALAGIGLFVGVLIYYVAPEQFVPASTGEQIYRALTADREAIIADLGLGGERIYVPTREDDETSRAVRLFVPAASNAALPAPDRVTGPFVIGSDETDRGVAFVPIGETLYDEFAATATAGVADEPAVLAEQLADASVTVFEFVTEATPQWSPDGDRCSIGVTGSVVGNPTDVDHPAVSLIATGFVRAFGRPVRVTVEPTPEGRTEYVITCQWDGPVQ